MAQPVLRTRRLLLVPLADRHLDLEAGLDADPEVLRFLYARARSRAEVIESHARRMALGREVDGLGYWMAFGRDSAAPEGERDSAAPEGERDSAAPEGERDAAAPDREEDGAFVGLMMLPPLRSAEPAVCELGYRLHRRFWGRGLASEAARTLIGHAFAAAGQQRVIAQTMAVNVGSRRVMEAVGMRYVRTFHEHWDDPVPGAEQGEVEYELTRDMWSARPIGSPSTGC